MKKIHLFSIENKTDLTGQEIFCWIINKAIGALLKNKGEDYALTPHFITEAFEKLKGVDFGEYNGQQAQEFLITSILKHYLESISSSKKFLLAFPEDITADSMIVETENNPTFKLLGENAIPEKPITTYAFQIKEVREQDDIFSIATNSSSGETVSLLDTKLFFDFRERFKEKIIEKGSYDGLIPILFLRAPFGSTFKIEEISKAFQDMNKGYFKEIWLIAPIERLENADGTLAKLKKEAPFRFLVHNVLNADSSEFVIMTMDCEFKDFSK